MFSDSSRSLELSGGFWWLHSTLRAARPAARPARAGPWPWPWPRPWPPRIRVRSWAWSRAATVRLRLAVIVTFFFPFIGWLAWTALPVRFRAAAYVPCFFVAWLGAHLHCLGALGVTVDFADIAETNTEDKCKWHTNHKTHDKVSFIDACVTN